MTRTFRVSLVAAALAATFPSLRAEEPAAAPPPAAPRPAPRQSPGDVAIQSLRTQIEAIKTEYEKRLKDLEFQVEKLQADLLRAEPASPAPSRPP